MPGKDDQHDILLPREVARILRVDPKTVTRWAKDGKIGSFRTPGGHRRFYAAEVTAWAGTKPRAAAEPQPAEAIPPGDGDS